MTKGWPSNYAQLHKRITVDGSTRSGEARKRACEDN